MKIKDIIRESMEAKKVFPDMLEKFVPIVMDVLKLEKFPKIKFIAHNIEDDYPTFGQYANESEIITLDIKNRHPLDILRTLAHELAHYKQDVEDRIGPHSGVTGSSEENEAHAMAGIIMRNFNQAHPEYFKSQPMML